MKYVRSIVYEALLRLFKTKSSCRLLTSFQLKLRPILNHVHFSIVTHWANKLQS